MENSRLQANSLSWRGQFFQAIAHMAPAAAIVFSSQFMASRAGSILPLTVILALIMALLLAYCLTLLTRKYYGASGYFQIHSRALGSRIGFTTSWLFFIYEPLNTFVTLFGIGILVIEPLSKAYLGLFIPWWVTLLVGNIITIYCSMTNIKNSMRLTTFLGVIEVIVFLLFGILLIVKTGGHFHPEYFYPSQSADGYGGLLFGFIFAFLMFMGFESGLPLTEETKNISSSTFKGILASVIFAGAFHIFLCYAVVVGFGGGEDTVAFARNFSTADSPFSSSLAIKAFGHFGPWLILFAALNSTVSACLAGQNAATRVFFALGRANVLPAVLGKVSKNNVPANAALFQGGLTFLFGLLLYFIMGNDATMPWLGMLAIIMSIALLTIHLMTCLSVFVAYRYKEQDGFRFIRHGAIPIITGLFVLLPIWGSIYYNPDKPTSYAPWFVLGWFILGLLVYGWLKAKRPQTLLALENEMDRLHHPN